jgi:hypothetical protein
MNSFLDANVIIKKIEYDYLKEDLRKKCFEHIQSSKGKIFISFVVKEELNRIILKRKEIYNFILEKVKNSEFEIDYNKISYLTKQDGVFAKDLYLKLQGISADKLKKDFDEELNFLKISLDSFLKTKINEIAIKKEELDKSIINILYEVIQDFADCRVLTSAIQMQQKKIQFSFITCDKHFHPAGYRIIEGDSRLKEYTKPKLKNFLFDN